MLRIIFERHYACMVVQKGFDCHYMLYIKIDFWNLLDSSDFKVFLEKLYPFIRIE
jgi:hypothetical protein